MDNKEVYISWNCNGTFKHLEDLQLLISTYDPVIVSLQETHFMTGQQFHLTRYNVLSYTSANTHASGGASIAIKSLLNFTKINLTNELQAVAATIHLSTPITTCSIYIPPNQPVTQIQLTNLITALPKPFIINGDFNAMGRNLPKRYRKNNRRHHF